MLGKTFERTSSVQTKSGISASKETFGVFTITGTRNSMWTTNWSEPILRSTVYQRGTSKAMGSMFPLLTERTRHENSMAGFLMAEPRGRTVPLCQWRKTCRIDNAKRTWLGVVAVWVIRLIKRPWHKRFATIPVVMVFNFLTNLVTFHKQSLAAFRENMYWSIAAIKLQIQFHYKKTQIEIFASKWGIA